MYILIKYMFSYSKKTASSKGSSMEAGGTVSHQGFPGDSFSLQNNSLLYKYNKIQQQPLPITYNRPVLWIFLMVSNQMAARCHTAELYSVSLRITAQFTFKKVKAVYNLLTNPVTHKSAQHTIDQK